MAVKRVIKGAGCPILARFCAQGWDSTVATSVRIFEPRSHLSRTKHPKMKTDVESHPNVATNTTSGWGTRLGRQFSAPNFDELRGVRAGLPGFGLDRRLRRDRFRRCVF